MTEIFIDRALARAAELDEHLRDTGKPVGQLHGLPISLKDQFDVKCMDTTIGLSAHETLEVLLADIQPGYTSLVGRTAEQDRSIVELMLQAGAIPYVKTNVPQTLLVRSSSKSMYIWYTNHRPLAS